VVNKMFSQRATIKQINRSRCVRISVFCALFAFASGSLIAQEAATSLEDLRFVLGKGDNVTVLDLSGKNIRGKVERIGPGVLEIRVGDSLRSFTDNEARQITRKKMDSPLNGILIGAGVGFGATLPLLWVGSEGDHGWAVAGAGLWGLIGGGIGALVDVAVREKQTVYVRSKSRASLNISPFYSNSGLSLQTFSGHFSQDSWRHNGGTDPSKGIAVTVHF
jgi:hypothetical protein